MFTEKQKAKIRKQNQERQEAFINSLNAEEKEKRANYISARDNADKLYADFFDGKATSEEFAKAELKKEKYRKAYYSLLIKNRKKCANTKEAQIQESLKSKKTDQKKPTKKK